MAKRHLTGKQLAFLFGSGILSGSRSGGGKGGGKGGKGEVHYNKARAKTLGSLRKRGVDVTSRKGAQRFNHNSAAARRDPILARSAAGLRAAHLRGGAGGSGRRIPSKAERDATRADRVAAGEKRLKQLGLKPGKRTNNPGLQGKYGPEQRAAAIGRLRSTVANTTSRERRAKAEARADAAMNRPAPSGRGLTRAERLSNANVRLDQFFGTRRGERIANSLERAAEIKDTTSPREANRFRLRREKAERTLESVIAAQRRTYNGFTGNQKQRYARLKNLERRLRSQYGI